MGILSGCKPFRVFEFFERICSVPHGSGNTKIASDLCVEFAKERGLEYYQDSLNNVIIYKGPSAGYEDSAPVILQGHLDMVCQKEEGCTVDMEREGLSLYVDGDFVRARGTTLGADNGIAVAMILYILDDDTLPHPPIEALFTVDEETGMDGAIGLDCSKLSGRRMINLDSEDEGVFTAGCAGGRRLNCSLPVNWEAAEGYTLASVEISGLLSGHSGVEIDKGRGSANRLMGRMLHRICESVDIRLVSCVGGELDNVIPKKCEAVIAVSDSQLDSFLALVEKYDSVYKNEFSASDPGVTVTARVMGAAKKAVTKKDTDNCLLTMIMLPYHVQDMSMDIKGLVQTSLNMGVLRLFEDGESFDFSFSVRSCITSCKEDLIRRVKATVSHMGGTVTEHGDYPAWQFAKKSPIRDTALSAFADLYGREGVVSATHGGLECGLFTDRIKGLDCISFGPEICDVHSPLERLSISSTERLTALVCEVLKRLK